MTIFYLIMSAFCVNGGHGYLLWSQRHERKWSLSVHAIKSRRSHAFYIAAHTLGGLFFVLFAKGFFIDTHNAAGLFYLSMATYLFEIIQALLPSRGKWEKPHTIAALMMWLCFVTAGLLSILLLDINALCRVIAAAFYVPLIVMLVRSYFDRSKLYFYQMNMVLLFYGAMFALVIGS